MGKVINSGDAKARFLELLAEVEVGETATIVRDGKPIAKLIPIKPKGDRAFGSMRGNIYIGPEFFEPLPESEITNWEG
jgi:prevent-host-death family protein